MRASARGDAQALSAERRDHEARVAAERAEKVAARKATAPTGIPAGEGLSAHETMMAQPDYQSLRDEFGQLPPPRFLEEELTAGARQAAAKRAEADAVKRAQRALDGRDDQK